MTLIELDRWRRDHKPKDPAEATPNRTLGDHKPKDPAELPPNRTLTSAGILPGDGEATASAHRSALKNAMHRLDACKLEPEQSKLNRSDAAMDETDPKGSDPSPNG